MSAEIKLTDQEINTICHALNVYYGQQHDAAAFFFDRLSSAAYGELKNELDIIEQLHDKLWGILQSRALGEEEE